MSCCDVCYDVTYSPYKACMPCAQVRGIKRVQRATCVFHSVSELTAFTTTGYLGQPAGLEFIKTHKGKVTLEGGS